MKYMLLLYADPGRRRPRRARPRRMRCGAWFARHRGDGEAGVMVAGDALQPADDRDDAARARRRAVLTDGPFAETKEILGGYYLIDVPDLDAADEVGGEDAERRRTARSRSGRSWSSTAA